MTNTVTIKQTTWLKLKPVDSTTLGDTEKKQLFKNQKVSEIVSWEATDNGHIKLEVAKNAFVFAWRPHIEIDDPKFNISSFLSREQLLYVAAYVSESRVDALLAPINATLVKYEINTPLRICHFLAQIAHESDGFNTTEEYADGSDYEGRKDLGNIYEGDGVRYKGRGLIQLTGRDNYRDFGAYLQMYDLEAYPELVAGFELACSSAGWFWSTHDLNSYADQDNFDKITRIVNGGFTGYEDRLVYLKRAKTVFNI